MRDDGRTMHIFTYGSLMYLPVWRRVVRGEYRVEPAKLRGHARRRIRGASYPGLVRATHAEAVDGILYRDVSAPDVAALDRFEGEGHAYARVLVPVELADGRALGAWTYLFLLREMVDDAAWDPAAFETNGLATFLETYCREHAP